MNETFLILILTFCRYWEFCLIYCPHPPFHLSLFLPSPFQSRSYNCVRVGTDDGPTNWYEGTIKKVYNKQVRDLLLWLHHHNQHQPPSIRQPPTSIAPHTSCTQIAELYFDLWYLEIVEAAVSVLAGSLAWCGLTVSDRREAGSGGGSGGHSGH